MMVPFAALANIWRLIACLWAEGLYRVYLASKRGKRLYVTLEVAPSYALGADTSGWRRLSGQGQSLLQLREDLKRLAGAEEIEGVILRVKDVQVGGARASDLIAQLERLRAGGRHVVAHAQGATSRELRVLSVADDAVITPSGRLFTFGMCMDQLLAKPLLDRLGIHAQFTHIGEFKTATHRFHKAEATPAQQLMTRDLLDGLSDQWRHDIAARRGVGEEAVRELMRTAPLDARRARRLGIISGEAFAQDLKDWIATTRPADGQAPKPGEPLVREHTITTLKADQLLKAKPAPWAWRPVRLPNKALAVLDLSGVIDAPDSPASMGGRGPSIKPEEVVPTLERLRKDDRVAGVLLHINSPGGSALSSDLIWQAVKRLDAKKPVVCYLSGVAASGGYYIAVAGRHIICREDTITGSIGVIAGKLSVKGALDKLGVNVDTQAEDENAKFMSLIHSMTPEVQANLQEDGRAFYRRFLERVGQSRHIDRRRLHRYARGRVYLGDEAMQRKLVDAIGGLDDAIAHLYTLCDLDERWHPVEFVEHHKQDWRAALRGSFLRATALQKTSAADTIASALGTPQLAETVAQMSQPLQLLELFAREHTVAIMPMSVRWE